MNPRVSEELAEARRRAKAHLEALRLPIPPDVDETNRRMYVLMYVLYALMALSLVGVFLLELYG